MKLYTPEEVWEDLRRFERYELTMPPSHVKNLRFTKLWRDYYGTPVRQLDPINVRGNVNDRIDYFLARENHVLPEVDRYPRSGMRFTVYGIDGEPGQLWNMKLKFLSDTNSLESFMSTMTKKLIPENKILYYVDSKYCVVRTLVCFPGAVPEIQY